MKKLIFGTAVPLLALRESRTNALRCAGATIILFIIRTECAPAYQIWLQSF